MVDDPRRNGSKTAEIVLKYIPVHYIGEDKDPPDFSIYMICDPSITGKGKFFYNGSTHGGYNIYFRHEACITLIKNIGCDLGHVEAIWSFIYDHYYIFGPAMIVIGLVYLFLGLKWWRATKMMSFIVLVYGIVCLALYWNTIPNPSKNPVQRIILSIIIFLTLVLSLSLGSLAGYFFQRLNKPNTFVVGLVCGTTPALLAHESFAYALYENNTIHLLVFLIITSTFCAILCLIFENYAIIPIASIGGSYFCIQVRL